MGATDHLAPPNVTHYILHVLYCLYKLINSILESKYVSVIVFKTLFFIQVHKLNAV